MDRVSAANYTTVGGKRQFQDINPGGGVLNGTELAALWHNGTQESICLAQEASGQASTDSDNTLLTKTILGFGAGFVTTVTSSQTLTWQQAAGLVLVNAASGNININLPAANSMGAYPIRTRFYRIDGNTANVIAVAPASGNALGYGGTPPANFEIAVGEMIEVCSDGDNTWICVDDSMKGQRRTILTVGTGTFTVPFNTLSMVYQLWGGGGGGGGSVSGDAGGGGGGGGYCETQAWVMPGEQLAYSVGAGGAGGASGQPGTAGGTTTIGSLSATGGSGGLSTAGSYAGAAGGIGSGGTLNLSGGEGNGGGASPAMPRGGAAQRGGDGGAASNGVPTAGIFPGGGGGGYGVGASTSGAAGANGLIVLMW